jgi:uncharacterized protein YjbI with pentapeptide repeats
MVKEKGTQAEERQDEPRLWRPWRPPRRRMGWRVLWAVGMVVALVVALLTTALLIVPLHPEIWKDLSEGRVLTLVALGFSLTAIVGLLAIAGARRSWTGFQGKTVWDFLQLLIVPLMLAVIGLWFAAQQDARQQRIENQRAEAERELAEQRAQDEALQAYLDQMSQLMLERKLLEAKEGDPVHTLAQARTSTVILRLDAEHNQSVTGFLIDSGLAESSEASPRLLRGIALPHAKLSGATLHFADLSDAILVKADLSNASLTLADLSDAGLRGADLSGADLNTADLSDAILNHADLSDAILDVANLSGAHLFNADLSDANLWRANLSGAQGITNEQIDAQARSLEDATMPDGQKYEDWLKDREKRQQDE